MPTVGFSLIAPGQVQGCSGATTASLTDAILFLRQSVQCANFATLAVNIKLEKTISSPPFIRVLLVDDFADWRDGVHAKLQEDPRMQIVGFAADGVEGILQAKELQPDLILLDIGLPKMDGIRAAREIRKIAAESKIVFLSQENDPDIVRAAIDAGGHGYVVKSEACCDLVSAMQAVMVGKMFLSRSVAEHGA